MTSNQSTVHAIWSEADSYIYSCI